MGVRILVNDRSPEKAVMYCSTSGWAFGPVFEIEQGHGDGSRDCIACPHFPDEQAEQFLKWFADGHAGLVMRDLYVLMPRNLTDPRLLAERDLEKLYAKWRERFHDVVLDPAFLGGDGYSETWTVPCPGCGGPLTWQRFLAGKVEGRFVDDDALVEECPRCGQFVDDYVPGLEVAAA